MENIVIIGASGHGSVILDCLEKEGKYNVIGFIDSYKKKHTLVNGYQVLESEYDLPYLISRLNIAGGIVAVGDNWTRKLVVERISKIIPSFKFINTIHPNAVIGKDMYLGIGNVFMPGAIVNANAIIHDFCIVNTNASLGHDGVMESYASLAPSVCTGGELRLGKYSALSLGVNVINGITIGSHTVIGAGALVLENMGDYVVAYGSPAKKVRNRRVGECYLYASRNDTKFKTANLNKV